MQVFRQKKGNAIVEGVMVFPVMIMAVVVLVFMMIYFYSQLNERVDMHIMLRAESGKLCDNMFYVNYTNDRFTVQKKPQQIYSQSKVSIDNTLILGGKHKEITARKYLIDESRLIRMTDVFESGMETKSE